MSVMVKSRQGSPRLVFRIYGTLQSSNSIIALTYVRVYETGEPIPPLDELILDNRRLDYSMQHPAVVNQAGRAPSDGTFAMKYL